MNNKIVKEILEKKFKKSIFSGYDPFDVDNFFDRIIIYINDPNKIKIYEIMYVSLIFLTDIQL